MMLQKLQREIANYRGLSYERSLGSPGHEHQGESGKPVEGDGSLTSGQQERAAQGETKRKYRRHPKVNCQTSLSSSVVIKLMRRH